MATKPTGRAASVARNQVRTSKLPAKPKKLTTPSATPTVAGLSTSGSGGATDSVSVTKVSPSQVSKPGTSSGLKKLSIDLAKRSGPSSSLRDLSVELANKYKKEQKQATQKRTKRTQGGRLAADNMRASETNLTSDESVTNKGGRSSGPGKVAATFTGSNGLKKIVYADGTSEYDETPESYAQKTGQAQLADIKAKALEVQEKYNALKANDTSAAAGAVVSDTSIVKEEKSATNSIAEAAKGSPISQTLALLDQQMVGIKDQLRNDIQEINRSAKTTKSGAEGQQQQETGQQSVQLANAGGYLGYSGGAQGVMLKLAEGHRAELSALDTARLKAINDAKSAAAERKFDVVKEKAAAVQRIEEAAYDAELKYQAKVQEEKDKEIAKAKDLETEADIMDAIKGGAKDVEGIFSKLDGKVDVETIGKLLKGITADVGDGFKFSASNNAALLGSGLGMDDIKAANEYINENGYDETIRATLTPSQRAAMDKVFLPIQKVTGSTATGKAMSILDLDRLEESYGVRFPFGVTQGEVTQFFADNPGASPEDMQQAINDSMGGGAAGGDSGGTQIQVNKDWLTSNLDITQQKKLADLVGASSWWTGKETDVNRMYNDSGLMQSLSNKIQELRDQGYSDDDILSALTS